MEALQLRTSTGNPQVDQILRDVVALFETRWPGRVRSYYLVGSYAVGEARPTSDIDLIVVAKHELQAGESETFGAIRAECQRLSAIPLDITLNSEDRLFRIGGVWFQTASLLVYGEDVRPRVPRKPVERHIRDLMHAMYPLLARVRGNPALLRYPLDYPNPNGALRGYDVRYLDKSEAQRTATKDLVSNVLGVANALTLLAARQYVGSGRKSDIPEQYRLWVGDQWCELVEDVFTYCRVRWEYQIPEAPDDKARLHDLCERTLAFENHFLLHYKEFLLAELGSAESTNQLSAARRLAQILYPDPAVSQALRQLAQAPSPDLRDAVAAALARYDG